MTPRPLTVFPDSLHRASVSPLSPPPPRLPHASPLHLPAPSTIGLYGLIVSAARLILWPLIQRAHPSTRLFRQRTDLCHPRGPEPEPLKPKGGGGGEGGERGR
uniref:Uncharacterized protein n=1 Tax=Knipowitschia caucasica TaxID=637954 RepID=A0AAV2MA87_KNICA